MEDWVSSLKNLELVAGLNSKLGRIEVRSPFKSKNVRGSELIFKERLDFLPVQK